MKGVLTIQLVLTLPLKSNNENMLTSRKREAILWEIIGVIFFIVCLMMFDTHKDNNLIMLRIQLIRDNKFIRPNEYISPKG